MKDEINSYTLSRKWFDFCFVNPEITKPNHTALYFFAIEHCNRLGWKEKFGFPTTMVMEAIGIKSYNTFIKTLNELVGFGFIKMIEKSKNQYSANIIALSNYNKAYDKALDKAFIKHGTKQSESIVQSIDSIVKQVNNKQFNNKQLTKLKAVIDIILIGDDSKFDFKKSLLNLNIEDQIISDWMIVRKGKKAANTKTAFEAVKKQIGLSNKSANECIKIATENNWSGFKVDWLSKIDPMNESPVKKTMKL